MPEDFLPEARRVLVGRYYGWSPFHMFSIVFDCISTLADSECPKGHAYIVTEVKFIHSHIYPLYPMHVKLMSTLLLLSTVWKPNNGVYMPAVSCKNWRSSTPTP